MITGFFIEFDATDCVDWNVNAIKFYENPGARDVKEWGYFSM